MYYEEVEIKKLDSMHIKASHAHRVGRKIFSASFYISEVVVMSVLEKKTKSKSKHLTSVLK